LLRKYVWLRGQQRAAQNGKRTSQSRFHRVTSWDTVIRDPAQWVVGPKNPGGVHGLECSKAENISAIRCLNELGRAARELDPERLPPDLAPQAVAFWDAVRAASTVALFAREINSSWPPRTRRN
jgi:hypothetical protein